MKKQGCVFWGVLPFLAVSVGLIVAGFLVDPSISTDDGFPLKYLLFILGGSFLVFPLVAALVLFLLGAARGKKMENQ